MIVAHQQSVYRYHLQRQDAQDAEQGGNGSASLDCHQTRGPGDHFLVSAVHRSTRPQTIRSVGVGQHERLDRSGQRIRAVHGGNAEYPLEAGPR